MTKKPIIDRDNMKITKIPYYIFYALDVYPVMKIEEWLGLR